MLGKKIVKSRVFVALLECIKNKGTEEVLFDTTQLFETAPYLLVSLKSAQKAWY